MKVQAINTSNFNYADEISMNFSDREDNIPQSVVLNAKDGKSKEFEIMDISKERIVLKEVGTSTNNRNVAEKTKSIKEEIKLNKQLDSEKVSDYVSEYSLEQSVIVLGADTIKLIESEGKLIENMTPVELGASISKIWDKLPKTESNIVQKTFKDVAQMLNLNDFKDNSQNNIIDKKATKYIIENDLELTVENVYKAIHAGSIAIDSGISDEDFKNLLSQIDNVLKQAGMEINQDNYDKAKWLINNHLPITPKTFIKLSEIKKVNNYSQKDWYECIETSIKTGKETKEIKLIINNVDVNELVSQIEAISNEAIKYAVENNCVINLKNLGAIQKEIIIDEKTYKVEKKGTSYSAEKIQTYLMQETQASTEADRNIGLKDNQNSTVVEQNTSLKNNQNSAVVEQNTSLKNNQNSTVTKQDTKDVQYEVGKHETKDVQYSIDNVQDIQNDKAYISTDKEQKDSYNEKVHKEISVRLQLEEIRLRMTYNANFKLIDKGIDIQTTELSKLVDELRKIDNEYYASITNNEFDNTQLETLKEVLTVAEELKFAPAVVISKTLPVQDIITLRQLHSEAINIKDNYVDEAYETMMTKPRKDMGDSIKKAFRNVDDILNDLGMEVNEINQRAVRILGYNSMEINVENIENIKSYDLKIQELITNLVPKTAIDLIRNNVNPLDIPIEDLNNKIIEIKQNDTEALMEDYSKFLWKMDHNKEISPQEREGYIGIYRLINAITKSDGAVIGAVVNAGMDFTLSNLLTSFRTTRSGGVNAKIDDEFGELEFIPENKKSIVKQINAAYEQIKQETVSKKENIKTIEKIETIINEIKAVSTKDTHVTMLVQELDNEVKIIKHSIQTSEYLQINEQQEKLETIVDNIQQQVEKSEVLNKDDYIDKLNTLNKLVENISPEETKKEYTSQLHTMQKDTSSNTYAEKDVRILNTAKEQIVGNEVQPQVKVQESVSQEGLQSQVKVQESVSQEELQSQVKVKESASQEEVQPQVKAQESARQEIKDQNVELSTDGISSYMQGKENTNIEHKQQNINTIKMAEQIVKDIKELGIKDTSINMLIKVVETDLVAFNDDVLAKEKYEQLQQTINSIMQQVEKIDISNKDEYKEKINTLNKLLKNISPEEANTKEHTSQLHKVQKDISNDSYIEKNVRTLHTMQEQIVRNERQSMYAQNDINSLYQMHIKDYNQAQSNLESYNNMDISSMLHIQDNTAKETLNSENQINKEYVEYESAVESSRIITVAKEVISELHNSETKDDNLNMLTRMLENLVPDNETLLTKDEKQHIEKTLGRIQHYISDIEKSDKNYSNDKVNGIILNAQINSMDSSTNTNPKVESASTLLRMLEEGLTPEKLAYLQQVEPDYLNMSIENIMQFISSTDVDNTDYYENKLKRFRDIIKNCDDATSILDSLGMDNTLNNIMAINNVQNNEAFTSSLKKIFKTGKKAINQTSIDTDNTNKAYSVVLDDEQEKLSSIINNLPENIINKETMVEQYEEMAQTIETMINSEMEDGNLTSEGFEQMRVLGQNIRFSLNLSKRECYEIPLIVDDSITNINLTIISNDTEKGKVNVDIDSEKLGKISTTFSIKGDKIKGFIIGDSMKTVENVKESFSKFEERIKQQGLNILSIGYGIKGKEELKHEEMAESNNVSNRQLYDVARAMIITIREMERKDVL